MGNLRSVLKAFERINKNAIISKEKEKIDKAKKLVLPGVGHFKKGMENLNELGLIEILNKKVVLEKAPILGICLGMQLMTNFSEEGDTKGLGWIQAKTIKFRYPDNHIKIPHIGWNNLIKKKNHIVIDSLEKNNLFYFVHSYYVVCEKTEDILLTTNYGVEFVSAFQKENIIGMQFHPEKSHKNGLKILKNFSEL